ncbi:MAG: 30S ribosomal protein S6 [Bacilli bacterium]
MKRYETMIILNANLEEEARKQALAGLLEVLTSNGAVLGTINEWGIKEFSYEINDEKRGYYVVVNFEAENPDLNKEFDRVCRINPNVVRHLVIRLDQ